jgi:hypothetical protein
MGEVKGLCLWLASKSYFGYWGRFFPFTIFDGVCAMNFIIKRPSRGKVGLNLGEIIAVIFIGVSLAGILIAWVLFLSHLQFFKAAGEEVVPAASVGFEEVSAQDTGSWSADSFAIRQVAASLGVPVGPALRLATFLADSGFSGKGPFKVKTEHMGLLQEAFIPGSSVDADISDPVINTNLALGLISSFHARGYSWEQSFLIYVLGWGELIPESRSPEAWKFLRFVFEEVSSVE